MWVQESPGVDGHRAVTAASGDGVLEYTLTARAGAQVLAVELPELPDQRAVHAR